MEVISVWLIKHKVSLDEFPPMNEGGSEFMVGTGCVPTISEAGAMSLFEGYLESKSMQMLELRSCQQYDPADFNEVNEGDRCVILAASS